MERASLFVLAKFAILIGAVPLVVACPTKLTVERVASGLARPVYVVSPPSDFRRLFIVEQFSSSTGRIKILNMETGKINSKVFFSISVSNGNEQGLLGLAFHPDYANNRKFYVNYTRADGDTVVAEYKASESDPDVADNSSARTIMIVDQPFSNHNGGWIDFGPDGYLYIAFGDGGDANDPGNRAQNLNNPLGKFQRVDVNGDDFPNDSNKNYAIPSDNPLVGKNGLDEIWHYGVRNPWRNSFDRATGDLYIGDVGQGALEEVSFQPAGVGGINYGWRCREGTRCTNLGGCNSCNGFESEPPIHEYSHAGGRCSITGGYIYRGKKIWDLRGTYFFADYCSNQIWSLRYDGAQINELTERTSELDPPGSPSITSITSFGQDQNGELYIVEQGGEIWRIIPSGPVVGDLDVSGRINFDDIDAFVLALNDKAGYKTEYGQEADQVGDINCDGTMNFDDIDPFVDLLIAESY